MLRTTYGYQKRDWCLLKPPPPVLHSNLYHLRIRFRRLIQCKAIKQPADPHPVQLSIIIWKKRIKNVGFNCTSIINTKVSFNNRPKGT